MNDDSGRPGVEPSEQEILARWHESKQALMNRAMEASRRAMSWRNFNVGCAVLAYRKGTALDAGLAVYSGANVKVSQDARPVCAEMTAILAALHAGYDRIIGLVVFGEPQEDHASGINPKHLHPCGECRRTMRNLPLILPTTKILSVKLKAEAFKIGGHELSGREFSAEEMDFSELLRIHENNEVNGK